ncbi:MAG: tyrosine-type recombinase/integrase [Candidatus Dormibacterales bacterium]
MTLPTSTHDLRMTESHADRWPLVAANPQATAWLKIQADLGLAPRTLDAYSRALDDFLSMCRREQIDSDAAGRAEIARYVRHLREQTSRRPRGEAVEPGGLSNATIQQRLVAVRLFYDHLKQEGLRTTNPVGRGNYSASHAFGAGRALVRHVVQLPWVPTDEQWHAVLEIASREPARNRFMFALAYDAALRREELCSLRTDDLDPAHRTVRVRAETTKTRRGRVVPYSAASGALLHGYLTHRGELSRSRGPLFLSESSRNRAAPITLWTWSKVVRRIAIAAGVPRFSTHTLRHLCLTDLARSGWELHAIASFAGHRSVSSTLRYIHLSGRELTAQLARGMAQMHTQRVATITAAFDGGEIGS